MIFLGYKEILKNKGVNKMEKDKLEELLKVWSERLRITPTWDVKLELVDNINWEKNGDIKIDCDDRKAIVMLNNINPKLENIEETIVHELMHLKMYPLDQVAECLIISNFKKDTPEYKFAYAQFFCALEPTVEELDKCFLSQYGENKEISFGRCRRVKPFNELFDGLRKLE